MRRREGQMRMEVTFARDAARLKWWVANRIPSLVAQAAQQGGYTSSSHYVRTQILRGLERDLGVDFEELEREQPSKAANKFYRDPTAFGVANSVEEVV